MPYKNIEELPDDVRDALPPPAQRIFLKVANKALDSGASDEKAFTAAWAAVKIAGFRKGDDGKWKKAIEGEMAEDKLVALCEVQAIPELPPNDWQTVDDLDVDIRAELPSEAQAIFLEAHKAAAGVPGITRWQAIGAGWNAVREAGWHYPTKQWVKIAREFATRTDDGDEYTKADYLVIPDADKPSEWKLRIAEYMGDRKQVTRRQLGRAAAALGPRGFRGQRVQLTPEQRRSAIRKLRALYKKEGVPNDEMPSHIRAREDFMGLASAAGQWRLLNDMALAEGDVPEWIQVIPAPGSWDHPNYGEIKITDEVLADFARNFEQSVYQEHIPVDAEHETKITGALGYYEEVKIGGPGGEGGLWARVNWTDRGEELLKADRFRYFSPEWYDEWEDPASHETFKNVLIGGALTTRPFFKDEALKPLVAREGGMWEVTGDGESDDWIELSQVDRLRPGNKGKEDGALTIQMTEDQLRELVAEESKKAVEAATGELKAEVAGHKQGTDLANMAREAAEGRVKTLEDDAKHRRFTDIVLGRDPASDGARPMIGETQIHVGLLETIAEAKGEESDDFKRYVYIARSHAEQAHNAGLFKELGAGGGDVPETAHEEIRKLVEKRMSEKPDLKEAEAISQVATENPELWERRDREHTGRKTPLPN